ncbi:MAG: hypothetical protein J6T15_05130 [Bacilli bacterium]|nr:hypothetical protein [Bacilli bacterium]
MARLTINDFSKDVKEIVNPNVNKIMIRSRYDTKTKLRLQDEKITIRNLKESDLTAKKTPRDLLHTVTVVEDQRPDLIALNFYKDARLYWVILGANGLRDASEIHEGDVITIPARDSIYGANGILLR